MVKNKEKIKEIMKENGAVLGYVFGSYARGEEGSHSDLDVAVLFETSIARADHAEFEGKIANELAKAMRVSSVDVVNLGSAGSPLLKHRAVFYGEPVLVKDKKLQFYTEKRIMEEYEDTKYLRALNYKIMRRQIKEGSFGSAPLSPAEERAFKKYAPGQRINK